MKQNELSTAAVKVEHITKMYDHTVGVKDISFEVHQGEIFGFLGPNGAGKTTAIRLMLDLLKPDEGSISIFGKDTRQFSKEIREMCGYLPGDFQAYKYLTGNEFLRMFSGFRNARPADMEDLLQRFGLHHNDLSRKTRQYSKGMLQKLGIIQAFMHNPKLIILDEPTSGLDPLMQEKFYDLIHQKQAEGTTVFFSSHNLPEVEKLCTRLAIVRHGSIISVESVESLQQKVGYVMEMTISGDPINLTIPGAELISGNGNHFIFKIKGEIGKVIEGISGLNVKDITITKPSLENVFMEYYKNN